MLHPTLVDVRGRPYVLWDCDLDVASFEARLRVPDTGVRAYFVAKLMRQAKRDDVFLFVTLDTIRELWPHLLRHLGHARPFWTWLLAQWHEPARAR